MRGHSLLQSLLVNLRPLVEGYVEGLPDSSLLDFGPVPFPSGARSFRRFYSSSNEVNPSRITAGGTSFAVSSFGLSMLSEPFLFEHLQSIHTFSQRVFFIDFKEPERNIEIPAAALLGGIRWLCSSSDNMFSKEGGLEGLLHRERGRFRIIERYTRFGGGIICILAECQ